MSRLKDNIEEVLYRAKSGEKLSWKIMYYVIVVFGILLVLGLLGIGGTFAYQHFFAPPVI